MPNLLRLYVSVSPSDLAFCQELVAQAGAVEMVAWFDHIAQDDTPFTDKHRQEILNRPACLVVLSPASFALSQMREEHTYIATLLHQQPERIVLPLVAQSFEPALLDEWPLYFPQLQPDAPRNLATTAAEATIWLRRLLNPNRDAPPDPESPVEETLVQVRALVCRGEIAAAQRLVKPLVAQAPESFSPRYCLGLIQLAEDDLDAAQRTYTLVVENDHESNAAWLKKAEAFYPYRKMAETFEALDLVAEREPENSFQWQIRGRAWRRNLEWAKALPAYDRSLELEPYSASCWFDKAYALFHSGKPHEALAALDQSLALLQTMAGWQLRAHTLIALKRYDDAVMAYDQALSRAPTDAEMLEQKSLLLALMSKHQEALDAFDRYLSDDVEASRASKQNKHYYRGLQLFDLRRYDEALRAYDAALTSEPVDDGTKDDLNFSEPLSDEQAILAKGDGEILRRKALTLTTIGRYADALPIYDALLTRIPIDDDLWRRKGLALSLADRTAEAVDALTYALTLVPNDITNTTMLDTVRRLHENGVNNPTLRRAIIGELTRPYGHSPKMQRLVENVLEIPYQADRLRSFADETVEDIEEHGYGFAYLQIDKISYYSDPEEFLDLARRLSSVQGIELDVEQRTLYTIARNPISLALFIYNRLLVVADVTEALDPLHTLCQRYGLDINDYLPRGYREKEQAGSNTTNDTKHDEYGANDEDGKREAAADDDENGEVEETVHLSVEQQERLDQLIEEGSALQEKGDDAGAVAIYEHLLRENPERGDILIELGDLYEAMGRDEDALDIYTRVLQADMGYSDIYIQLASIYLRQQRLLEALDAISHAYELAQHEGSYGNPLERAGVLRGKILLALHRGPEAIEMFDHLVEHNRNDAYLRLERGRLFTQMRQWAEAVPDFEQATQLKPDEPYAWHSLAYALNQCDRHSEALAAIDHALLLSTEAAILGTKGEIYLRMGDYTQAFTWLDRALKKNPDDGEHWHDQAAALRGLGRLTEAEEAEQRAQTLPDLRPHAERVNRESSPA